MSGRETPREAAVCPLGGTDLCPYQTCYRRGSCQAPRQEVPVATHRVLTAPQPVSP